MQSTIYETSFIGGKSGCNNDTADITSKVTNPLFCGVISLRAATLTKETCRIAEATSTTMIKLQITKIGSVNAESA